MNELLFRHAFRKCVVCVKGKGAAGAREIKKNEETAALYIALFCAVYMRVCARMFLSYSTNLTKGAGAQTRHLRLSSSSFTSPRKETGSRCQRVDARNFWTGRKVAATNSAALPRQTRERIAAIDGFFLEVCSFT